MLWESEIIQDFTKGLISIKREYQSSIVGHRLECHNATPAAIPPKPKI